jgi:hypothetical protein
VRRQPRWDDSAQKRRMTRQTTKPFAVEAWTFKQTCFAVASFWKHLATMDDMKLGVRLNRLWSETPGRLVARVKRPRLELIREV